MLTVTEGLVLADRYVVGRQLGVGGSGTVWRAHDQVLDRPVAVKVVPEGVAAARLAREARATAGIGVRNVVAVYDVGEQEGAHFLVMELVDGVDLGTLLAATGPLRPELVALVGQDLARGVAAVHEAQLVHRDVSPANVLVTIEGELKLSDLGIAQRTDEEATRRLTEVGTVVGTVDYLSPEQVEGRDVTAASDIYAVGLLLHTALTGEPPFGDGPLSERLARRLATDPEGLGEGELADVIGTAVRRDPADRYRDGDALREALAPLVPPDEQSLRAELGSVVRVAAASGPLPLTAGTDAMEGIAIGSHRPVPADAPDRPAATAAPDRTDGPSRGADVTAVHRVDDATTVVPTATTTASTSGTASPGPGRSERQQPRGDRHLLWSILGAVAGVLAVVALVSSVLAGGDGSEDGAGGDAEQATTALTIAGVEDHDPLGGGGEHGEDVGLAVDGDPATEWDTEGYNTAALGGLKDGVGLLLDLGEATEVAAVEVEMGLAGADLVVTVTGDRPEGDPTVGGTVLGTAQDTSGTVRVTGETVTGRWVALWFTSLGDDGGRFRAAVREVRVLGP